MTKREKADCRKIADHYGWQVERAKLIEEMGELKEAIEKQEYMESHAPCYLTYERVAECSKEFEKMLENLQEEVADVEICLHHFKYLMGKVFEAKVVEYRKQKIARQLQRMEAGE